jgi:hypothetical protein
MQSQNPAGEKKMTQTVAMPAGRIRTPLHARNELLNWNPRLQAELEALIEDNKQLRAALSIYSEVARRSPASLTMNCRQVA